MEGLSFHNLKAFKQGSNHIAVKKKKIVEVLIHPSPTRLPKKVVFISFINKIIVEASLHHLQTFKEGSSHISSYKKIVKFSLHHFQTSKQGSSQISAYKEDSRSFFTSSPNFEKKCIHI